MSALSQSIEQREVRRQGAVRASWTAFLAIISRDLLVTRRQTITFLLQTLVQPLFFLFVFGKVFTNIGVASGAFPALLLPGIVALTTFLTAMQSTSIDLARDLGFTLEIEDRLPLSLTLFCSQA